MTLYEAATQARAALMEAGIRPETATLDAALLARHAAGLDLAAWIARRADPADPDFLARYRAMIDRRIAREPVAYIRGVQEFWGRPFRVTSAVLIPRPETELLIEAAGPVLRDRPDAVVVDVGTGSGCLAVTLALEHPSARVYAVDISAAALEVARENAERLGAGARISFVLGSRLGGTPRPLDLIVANPPYVAERDRKGLSPEVREHEPAVALFGGDDGWREIRAVLREAAEALAPEGVLIMEMGCGQSDGLAREVEGAGLCLEEVRADLQGIPRAAIVRPRP